MKKIFSVFLTVFVLFSLTACGAEQPTEKTESESVAQSIDAESAKMESNRENSALPEAQGTETTEPSADELDGVDTKALVVYFSATGNTKAVAEALAGLTGAELCEIVPEQPYTDEDLNYNDKTTRATAEQNDSSARPAIQGSITDFEQYETVYVGYPIWWASIPMPVASFLEEYDFSEKTVIPFCSHGGGRFGQSLTAIEKLIPNAVMGDALSIHYSGGSSMPDDVRKWLSDNGIEIK